MLSGPAPVVGVHLFDEALLERSARAAADDLNMPRGPSAADHCGCRSMVLA